MRAMTSAKAAFFSVCLALSCLSYAEDLPPEYRDIVSVSVGGFHSDDKQLLTKAFINAVNTWLRKYEPTLLAQEEDRVLMRASYRSLYDIELSLADGTYEISVRLAKKVLRKARAQHLATHLSTGLRELVERELAEPKRIRQLERDRLEQARRDQEEKERRAAQIAAAIAEDKARVKEIAQLGHVRAYPRLAAYRYKKCQQVADVFLDSDLKKFEELFESGLESVTACSKEEEAALAVEVKLALEHAPTRFSDQIKDLHAYTVASLRALANFHQSAIEARQARAERSAGLDERTTRLELDF